MNNTQDFVLQWHITNQCDKNCTHCYMSQDERTASKDLTTIECLEVVDKFVDFVSNFHITPRICYTGGNPLKRKDIATILKYSRDRSVTNHILGNPTPLDDSIVKMLKDNNVTRYQLSFDGLESTHDSLRGAGSYNQAMQSIHILHDAGIEVVIMGTVTAYNKNELPTLAREVIANGASRFDFARLVPIGNGKDLESLCFTPMEYKAFLNKMYEEYQQMIKEGVPITALGTKDPLWSLLLYEKGELNLPENSNLIYHGCSIAKSGFCLDADGTLYGCRRMPVPSGNIKDTSLIDFFFKSDDMDKYRDVDKIEGCSTCEIMSVCRGCRAVAWAKTGSYYGRDPQCWKEI